MDARYKLHGQEGRKMKVDQLVQLYLRTGKLEGKTESTLTWYTRRLGQFERFLRARGHSMMVSDLRLEDGEAYLAALMEQDGKWIGHPFHKGHKGQSTCLALSHIWRFSRTWNTKSHMWRSVLRAYMATHGFFRTNAPDVAASEARR